MNGTRKKNYSERSNSVLERQICTHLCVNVSCYVLNKQATICTATEMRDKVREWGVGGISLERGNNSVTDGWGKDRNRGSNGKEEESRGKGWNLGIAKTKVI